MKPLKIDFRPKRLAPVWMVIACAVLIAIALGELAWVRAGEEDLQVRRTQLDEARAAARSAGQSLSQPIGRERAEARAKPYAADARRALKEASFSTAQALTAIEHVAMVGVTPISIELQAETGLVRLELEYAAQDALLKYLSALNEGEERPRWQLLRAANKNAQQSSGVATMESRW